MTTQTDIPQRATDVKTWAKSMGISYRSAYREMESGRLRPIRIGGRVLITATEAERYLAARMAEAANTRERVHLVRQAIGVGHSADLVGELA
jgi:predicted site-specific integrase-resolvase